MMPLTAPVTIPAIVPVCILSGGEIRGNVEAELGVVSGVTVELGIEVETEVATEVETEERIVVDEVEVPGRLKMFAPNESVFPSAGRCTQAVLSAEMTVANKSARLLYNGRESETIQFPIICTFDTVERHLAHASTPLLKALLLALQ